MIEVLLPVLDQLPKLDKNQKTLHLALTHINRQTSSILLKIAKSNFYKLINVEPISSVIALATSLPGHCISQLLNSHLPENTDKQGFIPEITTILQDHLTLAQIGQIISLIERIKIFCINGSLMQRHKN